MGTLSMTLYPLHQRQTRITRNSWLTRSICFMAALMRPPTLPNVFALSQTCLPLPYPSSELRLSTSGMRGTSTTTGLQPVSLAMSDNAELQAITDGIHQAYNVGLEDICQVHVLSDSANTLCLTMTRLTTWDSTCPHPFAKCWCLGSNTIQITVSISITAGVDLEDHQLAHILATSTHVEAGVHQSYLLTLRDTGQSHGCSMAGTHCSSPKSTSD
jgi:hypothetical protein